MLRGRAETDTDGAAPAARLTDRLGVRLALLLSLALLPVGAMAVLQTWQVIGEARERVEQALLSQTLQAAADEKDLIRGAIGAARVFGITVDTVLKSREECLRLFGDYVRASENVVFAGFIDAGGMMRCSSEQVSMRFTEAPLFHDLKANPRLLVGVAARGPLSDDAVVIVTVPVLKDGQFIGAISISISLVHTLDRMSAAGDVTPLDLVTFNADGQILTAAAGVAGATDRLPAAPSLVDLAQAGARSFTAYDRKGRERVFTLVPIVGDTVYAIAAWPSAAALRPWQVSLSTVFFPLAMWLISLVVAYFAVHRLVIRHIRRLVGQIRAFTAARRLPESPPPDELPAELREVSDAFARMTERILADEAVLENSIEEKNVLLREVHHRVRNNLQLIASMINMQLRRCRSDETREVLKRMQDRVMGLAAIHRNLYEASALSRVRADALVEEIIDQMLVRALEPGAGVRVTRRLEPVTLYPDQAVPLALLANEAVTNALKYVGRPSDGGSPWIDVRLSRLEDGRVRLAVSNSAGDRAEQTPAAGSGLGSQLIAAFVAQLDGAIVQNESEGVFALEVSFAPAEFGEHAQVAPHLAGPASDAPPRTP